MRRPTRLLSRLLTVPLGLLMALSWASAPVHAAPAGPTALAASAGPPFTLTWAEGSTAENGFIVERCVGYLCTNFGQIGWVRSGVTSFTDSYPNYAGLMSYRVRAFDSVGYSEPSNIVTVSWLTAQVIYPELVVTQLESNLFRIDGTVFAASFSPGAVGYDWSMGDGQIRSTTTPVMETMRYGRDGTFTISMRPVYATGRGATQSTTVTASGWHAPAPELTYAASVARGVNRIDWISFPSTATQVEVLRCKGSYCSNLVVIATVPLSANRFEDRTASRGATYTYQLRAVPGQWQVSETSWFTIRTAK
ncbi:MAG TPA: hypothetical protein P5181_10385 [Dermatophilaceae bacterium]|nr:hypothetical protein [Dermatophilaceae bacterium]